MSLEIRKIKVYSFQSKSIEFLNSVHGPQVKKLCSKESLWLFDGHLHSLMSTYHVHLSILVLTFLNVITFKLKVIQEPVGIRLLCHQFTRPIANIFSLAQLAHKHYFPEWDHRTSKYWLFTWIIAGLWCSPVCLWGCTCRPTSQLSMWWRSTG